MNITLKMTIQGMVLFSGFYWILAGIIILIGG